MTTTGKLHEYRTVAFYEYRAVAFISILGFCELIDLTLNDSTHTNKIHNVLNYIAELKHDNDHKILSIKELGKEVSVFSDSIVISYPMNMESAVLYLLTDVSRLQLEIMGVGIMMRGGVTVGELYHNSNIVYGPAIIAACELESKYAIYPRVIVHPEVKESGVMGRLHGSEHKLQELNHLLQSDEDHQLFVDFLNQWQEINDYNYFKVLDTTKALIEQTLSTIRDPRILTKYNWLKRYYNRTTDKLVSQYNKGKYI